MSFIYFKYGLTVKQKEFSSLRLNEMGRRLAGGLKSLGIGRGDHVVVSLSNSPELPVDLKG